MAAMEQICRRRQACCCCQTGPPPPEHPASRCPRDKSQTRTPAVPARSQLLLVVSLSVFLLLLTLLAVPCAAQEASPRRSDSSARTGEAAAREIIQRFSDLQGRSPAVGSASELNSSTSGSEEVTGTTTGLTAAQFEAFLTSATGHSAEYVARAMGPCVQGEKEENTNCTWKKQCPGTREIFTSYGKDGQLGPDGLLSALPLAMDTLTAPVCASELQDGEQQQLYHVKTKKRPTTVETWLYGSGFCTLVVIISNIGGFLGPCMETRFFQRLLQFLVSMGAGSLASTGLLVLIPEAFDVMSVEELASGYVWKSTVAILSIFTFFCSERLLKTFLYSKKKRHEFSHSVIDTDDTKLDLDLDLDLEDNNQLHPLKRKPQRYEDSSGGGDATAGGVTKVKVRGDQGHGHSHGEGSSSQEDRQSLAWMVMAGDVIHNFVDGLSVGAAFTEDISLGISISLAVLCEELPHELADIAILLHSGLSIKRAILINFLSACVVYLGLVLGIILGSTIHAANKWIFAMAGGLFLYVPLVDMLPDMSSHLDQLLARGSSEAKIVAVLHLVGLLIGTAIILFIVNINSYIVV